MTAARPSRTSSPSRLSSFSFSRLLSRAYLFSVRGQRGVEAGEMRAALGGVDVVGEREDRLDVLRVPLHRDLDLALVIRALEVDDVLVDGVLRLVDVSDEVADAALVVKRHLLAARALVGERDLKTAGEERRLAQTLRERLGRPVDLFEDLRVGHERDRRAGLRRVADDLHVALRRAARELLPVDLPAAVHLGDQILRQRVHDGHADAVQTAGDLVAVASELAAGVQLRQHDRECGQTLVLHDVDREFRSPSRERSPSCRGEGSPRLGRCDPRAPRRRRCRRPRRRGDGGRAGPSSRCTSQGAGGPARDPRAR